MKLKIQQEWTEETIKDFLSDFVNITKQEDIFEQANDVYEEKINKGWSREESETYARGYEEALRDIYNRTQ